MGALAEQHEVHLLDLPRFSTLARFRPGDAAGWLARWLDAAGLDRPALVGHSLGGLVAAQVAARRSDRLGALVLVDAAGLPTGWSLARQALALAAAVPGLEPSFAPLLAADALRAGPESVALGGIYASRADLREQLARIAVPTLVVWGGSDRVLPPRLAPLWRDAIAGARLVVLPRARHVPMVESPGELVSALLRFLGEVLYDERGDAGGVGEVGGVRRAGDDGTNPG